MRALEIKIVPLGAAFNSRQQPGETPTDIFLTLDLLPGVFKPAGFAQTRCPVQPEPKNPSPVGPAQFWVITLDPPKVPLGFSIRYGMLLPKRL